ncbi:DoxX family protein [Amphritea sp. HPY]|uniref:DoxX family protein n=1 Tax=Amphritea sp. HPY TaxID=3421652 RepID=UPI003D7CF1AA
MYLLKNDDLGKLIMRLTVGILILLHGVAKIDNPGSLDFIAGQLANNGLPGFIAYGVFVGEVVAPLLLIGGVYCRFAALVIVCNMLFAIGLVHTEELFMLTKNGGWALELQGSFLFGAVAIALLGSGRYAIKSD